MALQSLALARIPEIPVAYADWLYPQAPLNFNRYDVLDFSLDHFGLVVASLVASQPSAAVNGLLLAKRGTANMFLCDGRHFGVVWNNQKEYRAWCMFEVHGLRGIERAQHIRVFGQFKG